MNPDLNPFQPGAGRYPPELTGRDQEIINFDRLIARSKMRLYDRGIMYHGLRGVGKTVLLRRLQNLADRAGWLTIELEGSMNPATQEQIRLKLGRDLAQKTRNISQSNLTDLLNQAKASISSLSVTLGFASASLVLNPPQENENFSTGVLAIDFPDAILQLAKALKKLPNPTALALFIDEIQDLDDELLELLLITQHEAGQKDLPFYVIGAGLPSVPNRLGEIKTYAERLFEYRQIGALGTEATERALLEPVRTVGGKFEQDALDKAVTTSQGYPYFIQQYGKAIWNSASEQTITLDDVQAGIILGKSELDSGFYITRWDHATEQEQDYLTALAEIADSTGNAKTGDIAKQLGKTASATSVTRSSLIAKGLIYSPAYGKVAFTVPGMQDFVQRQKM